MSDDARYTYSVFTKPWPALSLADLAAHVKGLGFDAVELPIRPNFQVQPGDAERGLTEAAGVFADHGLRIGSVAAEPEESIIAACGAAGVPLIRTMVKVPPGASYMAEMDRAIAGFEALVKPLERAGVAVGIQNHCGREVATVMGVRHLVHRFDPARIGAVLDFGHCGLAGETPDQVVDQVGSHLLLVNLKNAVWQCRDHAEGEPARWRWRWTTGPEGMCPWPDAAEAIRAHGYRGDLCLSAEYDDRSSVDTLTRQDLAYARRCFG